MNYEEFLEIVNYIEDLSLSLDDIIEIVNQNNRMGCYKNITEKDLFSIVEYLYYQGV